MKNDCYNEEDETILNFLLELESWIKVDEETKTLAIESDITKWTNKPFRTLLSEWDCGMYDDDIDVLYQRVNDLLK